MIGAQLQLSNAHPIPSHSNTSMDLSTRKVWFFKNKKQILCSHSKDDDRRCLTGARVPEYPRDKISN